MCNFTLRLTKEAANALRVAGASNDGRSYLNGFTIDFDRKRVLATDGQRLLAIPFGNPGVLAATGAGKGNAGTVIVPRLPRKASGDVVIDLERGDDAGPVTIFAEYFTAAGQTKERLALESIDETFPDLDRVIPADADCCNPEQPSLIPGFNATYLADMAEAVSKCRTCRIRPRRDAAQTDAFRVEFPGSPLWSSANGAEPAVYIVMPYRI